MPRPTSRAIAHGHEVRDAYAEALRLLDAAYAAIEREPEHEAEAACDGNHPLDAISDARACLRERIDAIGHWLGVHDREAA